MKKGELMSYLIFVIIVMTFFLFTLSLCIAAGRADESAERLERELHSLKREKALRLAFSRAAPAGEEKKETARSVREHWG